MRASSAASNASTTQAFSLLFDTAEAWLRSRGAAEAVGPFSLSVNDECGLLVDGFATPPSFMMPHGKPYYEPRLAERGFAKVVDLLAYDLDLIHDFHPIARRILDRAQRHPNIRLRAVQPEDFAGQIEAMMSIFNDGWRDNWGFEPISDETAQLMANSVKPILMRDMIWVADFDGVPAAFAMALPNLNEALMRLRRPGMVGKWLGLALQLLSKRYATARMPLMGIRQEYHRTSLGAELALMVIDACRKGALGHGIKRAEVSWVLESNIQARQVMEKAIGGVAYKTYRILSKSIA